MARKKITAANDAEITKVNADMSRLQDRYDKLTEKLKNLQAQKLKSEAEAIIAAHRKSGKSFDELTTFLQPWGV